MIYKCSGSMVTSILYEIRRKKPTAGKEDVISYINDTFGLCEKVTQLRIV